MEPGARTSEWRAVVRDAWRVLKAYPVALIAPGAVLFLVGGVPSSILNEVDTDAGLRQVLTTLGAQLVGLVTSFLYYGYCEEVVRRARAGEVAIGAALAETGRVLHKLILAGLVTWFCIGIGFLALIVPGLWLLTRWALVSQVISFEHSGLRPSIRRSMQLTRGHARLILSTVVLAFFATEAASGLAESLGRSLAHDDTLGRVVGAALGQLLTGPFTGVIVATVYFRLLTRERADGTPTAPG